VVLTIHVKDLMPLEPGATHEFAAMPEYHNPNDVGSVGMYSRSHPQDMDVGLGLNPGTYSVRLGYHAFPGYVGESFVLDARRLGPGGACQCRQP